MMRDLFNHIDIRRAISPTRVGDDTAEVSEIIDLANANSCVFAIATGTLADADATFAVLIEDGDNSALTDNAAVADAFLIGNESGAAFTFTNDDETRKIAYIGPKRYVRITITPTNNSGNADLSVVAIVGHLRKGPDSSQS